MYYRHRYNPQYWDYEENPESREAAIRKLLRKITGATWGAGKPPPSEWHASYVSSHPNWTPIWLVSSALGTTPEELLLEIRPGRRRLRDVDELSILYEYMKDHLAKRGTIKARDVVELASRLGLATLTGNGASEAKERSYLLKQLVLDGYAEQQMGRFKSASFYLPTEKLLRETKPKLPPVPETTAAPPITSSPEVVQDGSAPVVDENKIPIPFYVETPEPEQAEEIDLEPGFSLPQQASPDVGGSLPTAPRTALKKILIVGGQGSTCPSGSESLRAIKPKECAWLDATFNWRVLASYRNEEFRESHLPVDVDLVIIFSKFMGHAQMNMITAHCKRNKIPFINNYKGSQLGTIQMAAEQAKTHSPRWFYEEYSKFAVEKKAAITRKKASKKKKKTGRRPRHRGR